MTESTQRASGAAPPDPALGPAAGHGSGSGEVSLSGLLLLADGRFPAGAHAHSGGLEATVALEDMHELSRLEDFLRGRAATVGHVAAAFTAAACAAVRDGAVTELSGLDDEFDARNPAPVLRTASRRLGRQMLRTGRTVWPHSALDELAAVAPKGGPHQPVALGAVAAVAGLEPRSAAWAAAHDAVVGPATAAIRLLGLDPFAVYALLARLGDQLDAVAADGAAHTYDSRAGLPARGTPLLDVSTERHATWEVRLFAS